MLRYLDLTLSSGFLFTSSLERLISIVMRLRRKPIFFLVAGRLFRHQRWTCSLSDIQLPGSARRASKPSIEAMVRFGPGILVVTFGSW